MSALQNSPYHEIIVFLTSSPTLDQIIDFHPSETSQARLRFLLDENRAGSLTVEQRQELDEIEQIEHFMHRLKIYARMKLATPR